MVSLEEKQTYLQRIDANPKLSAFKNMLDGQPIFFPDDNSQISYTDKLYYEITTAIQTNNKEQFIVFFNKKNKSNPSKDNPQPFIHDDYLIFSLIIGIIKFDCNKEWIKNVIAARTKNETTITFENILNRNFNHSENNKNIIFMYFNLIDPIQITIEFANETFRNINSNSQLFQNKDDFGIICSILSYNRIIELKTLPENKEIILLKSFKTRFIKRIKIIAWLAQTLFLFIIIWSICEIASINPGIKNLFDRIEFGLQISAMIGISQLSNILPWLKNLFFKKILIIFGYPKDLISK